MQKITIIKYLLQQKGGIEKRFQNYLMEFLQRGFEVTVLYGSEKESYSRIQGVNYVRLSVGVIPSRNLRKIFFALKTRKILESTEFKDQLRISMGRTGFADIVIAAGNYPETTRKDIRLSNWFRKPMYYLDKISFKDCKLIYAASGQVKNELIDLFNLAENRIKIIYPPVRAEKFKILSEEEKARLYEYFGVDPNRINFLFVSTGHKRKGLDFLLKLFAGLDPEKYVLNVAGDKFDTDLPNVKYLGYIDDTVELYNISDCLLHPASYEAFGQVITEALICGIPVYISDKVGAKEIISDKNGKVLPYNNIDAWLEAIRNMDHKPELLNGYLGNELDVENHVDKMLNEWADYSTGD